MPMQAHDGNISSFLIACVGSSWLTWNFLSHSKSWLFFKILYKLQMKLNCRSNIQDVGEGLLTCR